MRPRWSTCRKLQIPALRKSIALCSDVSRRASPSDELRCDGLNAVSPRQGATPSQFFEPRPVNNVAHAIDRQASTRRCRKMSSIMLRAPERLAEGRPRDDVTGKERD